MSHLTFPVTNPAADTINELNEDLSCRFEDVRAQFILTGTRGYTERDIAQTIHLYLEATLCTDQITGHDGESWQMVSNNADSTFLKFRRIYKLQDEFIDRCVRPMQTNMQQVCDGIAADTPENIAQRSKLISDISKLNELVAYYLQHDNTLRILEVVKYLC